MRKKRIGDSQNFQSTLGLPSHFYALPVLGLEPARENVAGPAREKGLSLEYQARIERRREISRQMALQRLALKSAERFGLVEVWGGHLAHYAKLLGQWEETL